MNQLDDLFNANLAEHTIPPSTSAWQRIESGLSKKNSPVSWMRWAAVLVPAAIAGILWLNNSEPTTPLATKTTPMVIKAAEPSTTVASATPVVRKNTAPKTSRTEKTTIVTTATEEVVNVTPSPESVTTMTEVTIEPMPEEQAPPVTETRPIVLVYTLESIAPALPVTEEIKPSSLQRVVEIANTVKHSDPLSDLRGMKDELLAIDLRKKTTKKN